ncbi:sensor histidine kinase [Spirochaeta lutea]|uniref:histidine kinase n=1 Tax=Spirochaeta lutea TaxID=1480694 RepID=A0A098QZ22_9SPIO|nr:HAMP domain-containing sensor histidine kinase [Spirochaeta lutea]KGE71737.1 hypothetical protein DC28_10875 [Spirochaeta lutea]
MDTSSRPPDDLLHARIAYLNSLTGSLSHEVNTPIGIGITALSFIEDETKQLQQALASGTLGKHQLEDYLKTTLETAKTIGQNLERAVETIQTFRSITSEHLNSPKMPVSLRGALDTAFQSLADEFSRKGVVLENTIPEDLTCLTRPGIVQEILYNLLSNSVKHAYPPGRTGRVLVDAVLTGPSSGSSGSNSSSSSGPSSGQTSPDHGEEPPAPHRVVLTYRDDGQGIHPVQLKHLYRPFFTSRGKDGACGLGMNIVHRLVTRELRGTIDCSSSPESGTTFRIDFPCATPDEDYGDLE